MGEGDEARREIMRDGKMLCGRRGESDMRLALSACPKSNLELIGAERQST